MRFHTAWLSLAFCAAALSVVAAPQVTRLDRYALEPGKTIDLTLFGQNLTGARQLWTTFAARTEFVAPTDEAGQKGEKLLCRVTVPREEQVGIGTLRIVTGDGVSNPLLMMLDDLRSTTETSDDHTIAAAQPLQPPIAVDGQCDPIQEDFYRFHAEAGQTLSIEVVAQRLGSQLDPVVRLLAADGTPIQRIDDAEGAGGDTRFVHSFTAAGDYILAISDVRHLGGAEYRYRLRLGAFPIITTAYPLGGRRGSVMSFELAGYGIDPESKLNVLLPTITSNRALTSFGVPAYPNAGSGWFFVETTTHNEMLETEPNDTHTEATAATFPGVLNGRLDKSGDRDCFKFIAHKGQRVHCVAKTRELGSACDVDLALLNAGGTKIASARQERQTVLDADISEDGAYVLQVSDLSVGETTTNRRAYRIEATETYAGFALRTSDLQYTVPQAGTVAIKVIADRRGYSGPIDLAVDGLGDGVTLAGNSFDGGETVVKITVPPNLSTGEMRLVRIVGKVKVGEQPVTVAANEREVLRTLFPNTPTLPAELEDYIAIAVGPPFPAFFELAVPSEVYFPQLVGTSTFDVNINRPNAAFKDPIALTIEDLPKEITAKVEPVGDGLKAARVTLSGPPDIAEGEFPIRIIGTATFQDQSRKVVLDAIKLKVTKPLVISVSFASPLIAGAQQFADVKLQRFGTDSQPVRLQVFEGPEGLLAPISITVPADANELKLPISTLPAATGKFNNFALVATTQVKGQNISVRSQPASGEITPPPAK